MGRLLSGPKFLANISERLCGRISGDDVHTRVDAAVLGESHEVPSKHVDSHTQGACSDI